MNYYEAKNLHKIRKTPLYKASNLVYRGSNEMLIWELATLIK